MTILPVTLAMAACTPTPEGKEPPLTGTLTLAASSCLGFCPVYTMRLDPEDRYDLKAAENTTNPGRHKGALPVNSYRRALEALDRYDFETLQDDYSPATPENCPDRVTGTPSIQIARRDEDSRKIVTYDTGCIEFADKDRLDQLVARLNQIYRIDALVAVGEKPKKK